MPTFDPTACAALIEPLTALGVSAAATIRRVNSQDGMRIKADGSPVTAADEAAEAAIRDGLTQLAPDLPIISEEHAAREQTVIKGPNYFLVDPLDGTREFIAGHKDYTGCPRRGMRICALDRGKACDDVDQSLKLSRDLELNWRNFSSFPIHPSFALCPYEFHVGHFSFIRIARHQDPS